MLPLTISRNTGWRPFFPPISVSSLPPPRLPPKLADPRRWNSRVSYTSYASARANYFQIIVCGRRIQISLPQSKPFTHSHALNTKDFGNTARETLTAIILLSSDETEPSLVPIRNFKFSWIWIRFRSSLSSSNYIWLFLYISLLS